MNDQKRENLLNLSLDATTAERAASSSLSTGYDFTAKTWEVIVQYQGDISFLEQEGVRITYLFFQYAILTLPEQLVDYVTKLPQITYMEMPKRLFSPTLPEEAFPVFSRFKKVLRDCSATASFSPALIPAWIIPTRRSAMQTDPQGSSLSGIRRFPAALRKIIPWEPSIPASRSTKHSAHPPRKNATVWYPPEIPAVMEPLSSVSPQEAAAARAVCIGASPPKRSFWSSSWAPLSPTLSTHHTADDGGGLRGPHCAISPETLAINLSFGNNYGSHSGTSLLETYLNQVSRLAQNVICIGSGNEGISARHAAGTCRRRRPKESNLL